MLRVEADPLRMAFPCKPNSREHPGALRLQDLPRDLFVHGAVERIARLRKGRKVTLTATARSGYSTVGGRRESCPKLEGEGRPECATTKLTIVVRRVS